MPQSDVTIDDLRRILTDAAGVEDGIEIDAQALDEDFDDLGYDSLALLEAASRIKREYGISLEDDAATSARTPRLLLSVINAA